MSVQVSNRLSARCGPSFFMYVWVYSIDSNERLNTVAKKKVKFQGFVSLIISKTEKAHIKENILSDGQVLEFIVNAAELGYKVSASFSQDGGFYTFTLYGNHADNPNAGYAASIRHRDLYTAVTAMSVVMGEEGTTADWTERFDVPGHNDW